MKLHTYIHAIPKLNTFRYTIKKTGLLLLWVLFSVACQPRGAATNLPLHNGPLFRTNWSHNHLSIATNSSSKKLSATEVRNDSSILKQIVNHAKRRLTQSLSGEKKNDVDRRKFGATDIQDIFSQIGYVTCWQEAKDVAGMAKIATRTRAYKTTLAPQQGDLVLFHNQFDRNRNGQSDDWFTGIAIVTEVRGKRRLAITRTGYGLKEIVVSTEGPMVHTFDGESVNSFVKVPTPHDPVDAQYLAGQLYAGYIDSEQLISTCPKKHK